MCCLEDIKHKALFVGIILWLKIIHFVLRICSQANRVILDIQIMKVRVSIHDNYVLLCSKCVDVKMHEINGSIYFILLSALPARWVTPGAFVPLLGMLVICCHTMAIGNISGSSITHIIGGPPLPLSLTQ